MAERKIEPRGKGSPCDERRILEQFLTQQLGLEGEWRDPDSIVLPEALPDNGDPKLSRQDAEKIEAELTHFVDLGCNMNVLYWCIQQLSPDANRRREGDKVVSIPNEDEAKSKEKIVKEFTASRKYMKGVSNKIQGIQDAIKEHSSEFLLVAEACPEAHLLPSGWLTDKAPFAAEAMLVFKDYLRWVKGLADSWRKPNVKKEVKSKGTLYLLAYVWLHSQTPPKAKEGQRKRKDSKEISPYWLAPQSARYIATIETVYAHKSFKEKKKATLQNRKLRYRTKGLQDKLRKFCIDNPNLLKKLVTLLKALDAKAAKTLG